MRYIILTLLLIALTSCGKDDRKIVMETIRIIEEYYPESSHIQSKEDNGKEQKEDKNSNVLGMVYICTSSGAETYHTKRNCGGLNQCGQEIKQVSQTKATQMKRRLCRRCSSH